MLRVRLYLLLVGVFVCAVSCYFVSAMQVKWVKVSVD